MMTGMQSFLLKSEPETYSLADLERDGKTAWDGVRNHTAKLALQAMQVGDEAFIYHSGDERQVVGVAKVIGAARPDPTDATGKFVCVDIAYVRKLKKPVTLKQFKDAQWNDFGLVRLGRLSCMPVPADVRAWILEQENA
jgi:predicted RNA-binding protein with PUA-like domain